MRFFPLLISALHVAARITLLDEHKSVISVPTFDFFEYRSSAYNVTGIACRISLTRDPSTQLCSAEAPLPLESSDFTQAFQQTIMFVSLDEAYKCGISTITQLFGKAHDMLPHLAGAGYPPSKTLVIFSSHKYEGVVGCPVKESYMSRGISVPDSPPPHDVNVALVGGQYTTQFLEALDNTRPYAFNVVQETDPWNALFLSFGYVSFSWCSIAIYFVAVVAILKSILGAYRKNTITLDLRSMIIWMAILAALGKLCSNKFLVNIVALAMRHETNIRRNLETISGFLISTAFLVFLYFWSVLLMNIQPSKSIYILRATISFSMLVLIIVTVTQFICYNTIYVNLGTLLLRKIVSYLIQATFCLLAIISVAFGIKFHITKNSLNALPQTVAAFTYLSFLGLIVFLEYAAMVLSGFLLSNATTICEPVILLATVIMKELAILIWITILLLTFRVKADSKS